VRSASPPSVSASQAECVRDRPRPLQHHRPRTTAAAMSFLFGKKSKQQSNTLPPATREITSSHGPGQPPPAVNGTGSRELEKPRGGPPSQTPTPGTSVNNSLSSLQNPANAPTPEPKALREKADTNIQVRAIATSSCRACADCDRTRTPDLPAIRQTRLTPGPPAA